MPIYEYACKQCEHEFDVLQKMSDPVLTDCPECGESALRKLISAPSFRLKGSGWYETDFKSDNKRNLAGDAADKPAKPDDKKDADKKPEDGKAAKTKADKPAKTDKSAKSASSSKKE